MYERYAGLIFDMDGTILDTEPTHRKAWREVLGHYGLQYDVQAMIALNGSPTWRIAQAIIELNQADLDPHALAREKTEAVRSMLLDSVEPLPLVEVVKSWHGRRPMAVGTGKTSPMSYMMCVPTAIFPDEFRKNVSQSFTASLSTSTVCWMKWKSGRFVYRPKMRSFYVPHYMTH